MFIATSRADIAVLPLLIILLGWRWRGWQGAIVACVAAAVLAAGAWLASPYLRERVQRAIDDVEIYRTTHVHNDVGDHVEFLKKSMAFVREAPVFGHGTGSIPELFRRSAVAQSGAAAIVSVNNHGRKN